MGLLTKDKTVGVFLLVLLVCLHYFAVGNWKSVAECMTRSAMIGAVVASCVSIIATIGEASFVRGLKKVGGCFIAIAKVSVLRIIHVVFVVAAMTGAHVASYNEDKSVLLDFLSSNMRNHGVAISADSIVDCVDAVKRDVVGVSSACVDGGGVDEDGCDEFFDARSHLGPDVMKVFCNECGFVVVEEGHVNRCKKQEDPMISFERRRRAWLGDALHKLDVFFALMHQGKSVEQAKNDVGYYIHQKSQIQYMQDYEIDTGLCVDGHAAAQVFESCYLDDGFRRAYIARVFGIQDYSGVLACVALFNYMHETKGILNNENFSYLSFVGEQLFTYEMRKIILDKCVDNHGLQPMFSSYTSSYALANYVKVYGLGEILSRGSSNSSLAKAFRANWYGDYRKMYLRRMFGVEME